VPARGIVDYATYRPYRRLDLGEVAAVAGGGGGKGTRPVASYDEDATTMAVAAARGCDLSGVAGLWFATTTPAYADKTNATAVHAALRLDAAAPAFDANGAVRSAIGALRAGLAAGGGPTLVVAADMRTGLPGSPDEAAGGDGAAAFVVGDADPIAEVVGWGSATAEFLDRWRAPGAPASRLWEERFGEGQYVAAGRSAWEDALKATGLAADEVDRVAIVGSHARAGARLGKELAPEVVGLPAGAGFAGAAAPGLALAHLLDTTGPGRTVALVVLADGADVVVLRTTGAHRTREVEQHAGAPIAYGTYLRWRGLLTSEPPRRPEPARPSASAAGRSVDWKFGFVGSQGDDGTVHLPPALQDRRDRPMADAVGTVVTFTIDRLAYSPSPPVVFAVVDFDGGGRLPVELTDVDPADVAVGTRVEMTFRKLFTSDGIHNYFWKARPIR
jgi:3-hydroxy-3-methylglutaryl CoA synthase/uncharacterized OB-fold protein